MGFLFDTCVIDDDDDDDDDIRLAIGMIDIFIVRVGVVVGDEHYFFSFYEIVFVYWINDGNKGFKLYFFYFILNSPRSFCDCVHYGSRHQKHDF